MFIFQSSGLDATSIIQKDYRDLSEWLLEKNNHLGTMIKTNTLPQKYSEYEAYKAQVDGREALYKKLKALIDSHGFAAISESSWKEIDRLWKLLQYQLRQWLWQLDSRIPGGLAKVGEWLAKAEQLIYHDDVPTIMNEETATIISRKLEEHKQFFADLPIVIDKFEKAKLCEADNLPPSQLRNMEMRLRDVEPKAVQRRIRLKFLEHKCCLIAFLHLTEMKLKAWTVKYGREEKVQQLLEQYRNFVSRNKIFQEFSKAYQDMQQVVEEYKRDGMIDKKECADVDRFMRDTAERWKGVSMELRCVQSMLEEVVSYWKRWTQLAKEFEDWLDKAEAHTRLSDDERMEFFQDISVWKEKYQLLSDTVSFLVATCEDNVSQELHDRFGRMTSRWEQLFKDVQQYMHAGDILRNRKDYRFGVERLSAWLRNAENVLESHQLSTTEKIKAYGAQIQQIQNEIDEIEDLFKNISKAFQSLIQDLSRDEVDKMMNTLKREKEALVRVRALIPMKLNLFHQLLVQQESLEAGQKEIHQWLDEAEKLLSSFTASGGRDVAQTQLDKLKSFFSRSLYYKSMLDSKRKVFQNIVQSLDKDGGVDTTDGYEKMKHLNERFIYVMENAQQWEQRFQEILRCWHNFNECERTINDWLHQAESLLGDKHVENRAAIDQHKAFFDRVNDRWMQDLVQSGQDLMKSLPQNEQLLVQSSIENLQRRWKDVLAFAPLHLMKMEFRLDEISFAQYLKDVEKEIINEQHSYNRNENVDSILARNQEFFKPRGISHEINKHLENMKRISVNYEQRRPSDDSLKNNLERAQMQWQATNKKLEELRRNLQQIPQQWNTYHERFATMVVWMNHVDNTLKNILTDINSVEEFEKEKAIFQVCKLKFDQFLIYANINNEFKLHFMLCIWITA